MWIDCRSAPHTNALFEISPGSNVVATVNLTTRLNHFHLLIISGWEAGFEPRYTDPEPARAVDSTADQQLTSAKRIKSEQNEQPPRNQNEIDNQNQGAISPDSKQSGRDA